MENTHDPVIESWWSDGPSVSEDVEAHRDRMLLSLERSSEAREADEPQKLQLNLDTAVVHAAILLSRVSGLDPKDLRDLMEGRSADDVKHAGLWAAEHLLREQVGLTKPDWLPPKTTAWRTLVEQQKAWEELCALLGGDEPVVQRVRKLLASHEAYKLATEVARANASWLISYKGSGDLAVSVTFDRLRVLRDELVATLSLDDEEATLTDAIDLLRTRENELAARQLVFERTAELFSDHTQLLDSLTELERVRLELAKELGECERTRLTDLIHRLRSDANEGYENTARLMHLTKELTAGSALDELEELHKQLAGDANISLDAAVVARLGEMGECDEPGLFWLIQVFGTGTLEFVVGFPRSVPARAIQEMAERDWVERGQGMWRLTDAGRQRLRKVKDDMRAAGEAGPRF